MESPSFIDCPFPIAGLSRAGVVQEANRAWRSVANEGDFAWQALALAEVDAVNLEQVVRSVSDSGASAWLDVDVHALASRRWARCHLWAAAGQVCLAVIPLREIPLSEMTRADVDHIERVLEHAADAILVLDQNLDISFASGIATRLLGETGAQFEGEPALGKVFVDDHQTVIEAFSTCLTSPQLSVKARFRTVHSAGHLVWVEAIGTNMLDDPAVRGILVTLNDITELVEARAAAEAARAALEAEKRRYETLAQFTPTAVFELDAANRLTFSNERFRQILNLDEIDRFDVELFDERDRAALAAALAATRAGTPSEATLRMRSPSGEPRWLTVRGALQEDGRILGSLEDETSQIVKQAELEHRADHDDLTGLPNRESLLERLELLVFSDEPIAVLFLDLDRFKDINDDLGHQVGDQVLIEVAQRIKAAIRPDDIVGRLHGDEFLVVCRNSRHVDSATEIATRIIDSLRRPLAATGDRCVVMGSVGIAMSEGFGTGAPTPQDLIGAADEAMYEAKRRGGATAVAFHPDLARHTAD